ncbi:hypothetical protein BC834DRAFT_474550 [Gloeopeniophorella convolvens]|nr:hypothetical protein BC834DRAFT_474550 [Gloeopeniophorella convolvens]
MWSHAHVQLEDVVVRRLRARRRGGVPRDEAWKRCCCAAAGTIRARGGARMGMEVGCKGAGGRQLRPPARPGGRARAARCVRRHLVLLDGWTRAACALHYIRSRSAIGRAKREVACPAVGASPRLALCRRGDVRCDAPAPRSLFAVCGAAPLCDGCRPARDEFLEGRACAARARAGQGESNEEGGWRHARSCGACWREVTVTVTVTGHGHGVLVEYACNQIVVQEAGSRRVVSSGQGRVPLFSKCGSPWFYFQAPAETIYY